MKSDEDCNGLLTEVAVSSSQRESYSNLNDKRTFLLAHLHLFLIYLLNFVLVIALVWALNRSYDPSLTIYSPANGAVEYETKVFLDNIGQQSPYQGAPTDEKDAMWDELYGNGGFTMLDKESADKLPNKTIEVPRTGGKYLVTLEIFHQLHCLNVLRKHSYPERYPQYNLFYPNGTRIPLRQEHLDHCIDRLRQGVMCSGDLGTLFWTWREDRQKWSINMQSTHSCRNFDKIREWAFSRNMEASEIDSSIITSN